MTFPIFIISLTRDTQRRTRIAGQLSKMGIDFQFFDAIDYRSELFKDKKRSVTVNNLSYGEMTEPEMACTFSHLAVYQKIIDSNIEWALILEDDVTVDYRFADVIHALSRSTDKLKNGCTYVLGGQQGTSDHQLFGLSLFDISKIGRVSFRKATYKKHKVTRACSYIVDKRYCQQSLKLFASHGFYLVDDRKILLKNSVMDDIYFCDLVTHPIVNTLNSHLENSRVDKNKGAVVKKRSSLVRHLLLLRYKIRVLLGSFI